MAYAIATQGTGAIETQRISAEMFARFTAFVDAKPKTVETYTKALRQLFRYFSLNGISQPCREDVISFREDLKASGHKPTTVQAYIAAARLFFKWTAQEGIYPNVAENIKGAKLSKDHKKDYLTSSQVKSILADIDRTSLAGLRDFAMLALMVTCGLRTIEVCRANVGDLGIVADSTVLFVQGKGRDEKAEYVKIPAPVEKAVRAYLKGRGSVEASDPLFVSDSNRSRGQRISLRTISWLAKSRMADAGFDSNRLTAHSLRHTAVTLSLLAGKDITEVQQFARHANIATTMIYNHALDKAKNGCSEAVSSAIF